MTDKTSPSAGAKPREWKPERCKHRIAPPACAICIAVAALREIADLAPGDRDYYARIAEEGLRALREA